MWDDRDTLTFAADVLDALAYEPEFAALIRRHLPEICRDLIDGDPACLPPVHSHSDLRMMFAAEVRRARDVPAPRRYRRALGIKNPVGFTPLFEAAASGADALRALAGDPHNAGFATDSDFFDVLDILALELAAIVEDDTVDLLAVPIVGGEELDEPEPPASRIGTDPAPQPRLPFIGSLTLAQHAPPAQAVPVTV